MGATNSAKPLMKGSKQKIEKTLSPDEATRLKLFAGRARHMKLPSNLDLIIII